MPGASKVQQQVGGTKAAASAEAEAAEAAEAEAAKVETSGGTMPIATTAEVLVVAMVALEACFLAAWKIKVMI